MTFPVETFDAICDRAVKSTTPEVVRVDGCPGKAWLVIAGDPIEIDLPPALRTHTVESVADLVAFVGAHNKGRCVVWHSVAELVLIIDDSTRTDCVTMPLRKTDGWKYIEWLSEWWSQRDLIFCLRRLGFDGSTIAAFRSLDWQTSASTNDLPQELCINAVVYRNTGEDFPQTVPFWLDYDIAQQRIYFQPEPDSLALIERMHQRDLHERLLKAMPKDVEVYHGQP